MPSSMEFHRSCPSSVLEEIVDHLYGPNVTNIPDKVATEYVWDFLIPPKSRVQQNIAAVSGNGFSFNDLKFKTGFLSRVEHNWGISFYSNQINVYISLPNRNTDYCAFTVNRSQIELISKHKTESSHRLLFKKEDFSHPAKPITWAAFWSNNSTGAWTESIDTIRVILSIEMETGGKCIKNIELNSGTSWTDDDYEDSFNASKFFDTQTFSDVKIICGDRSFYAHKFLLSCRSNVFASMFQNNMRESLEGRVEIEDMDASVLEEMLRYMYTGKINDIEDHCEELLIAAEKYELYNLKRKCQNILIGKVTPVNAMSMYTLADTHRCMPLMTKALDVIKSNKNIVISESESFKHFVNIYPQLMFDLFKI